jgi:hypothetical protein
VPSGSGRASGVVLDGSASGARYGIVAGYAWQRLELEALEQESVPSHATSHRLDAGVVVFPTPTFSVRAAVSAGFGRKGSAVAGAFEWEACNLIDGGCEFAGTPLVDGPVGGVVLPDYLRVDLGARKHWHVRIAGRESLIAVFATVTNLFGRRNVLALTTEDDAGTVTAIEMLPLAPLVIGVDWDF